jgi:hypothetical protein
MKTRVDKHRRKYIGPFQIAAKQSPLSYLVEDIKAIRKKKIWRRFPVHVSQIKPYKTPRDVEYETQQQDQQAEETTTAVRKTRSGRQVKPVDRWHPP